MDAGRLAAVINKGLGIAARNVGELWDVYRPNGASRPLDPANKVTSLRASFAIHSGPLYSFDKPSDYRDSLFHGMFDRTLVRVGDYFVRDGAEPFFVASLDPIVPSLCVQCNRRAAFARPFQETGIGLQPYGGSTAENETNLIGDRADVAGTGWPVSCLESGKGGGSGSNTTLPGDTGTMKFEVLFPDVAGVILEPSDIMHDEQGFRYGLSGVERTALGYRLKVNHLVS